MFDRRISEHAQSVLALLKPILPPGTYLAGGTALALQLDHRDSFDLDLYSPNKFQEVMIWEHIREVLPDIVAVESAWQTVHFFSSGVEVSLFYYQHPLLSPPALWKSIPIASIADIAAMKVEAISGRGLKRDFFDLFTICTKEGWSLSTVLNYHEEKYHMRRSMLPHILKSFLYFDDAETKPERAVIVDEEWESVKLFFSQETPKLMHELLHES